MDEKLGFEWFVIFSSAIGAVLGYWLYKNVEKGQTEKNAAIPLMGPLLAYSIWKPTSNHQWNIILNKVYVAIMVAIGVLYHPFFLVFALMVMVLHVDWLEEK
jgi:hypothetical protein